MKRQRGVGGLRHRILVTAGIVLAAAAVSAAMSVTTLRGSSAALPGTTAIDHPAGIAFHNSDLIVAVGSSGSVLGVSSTGSTTLASGLTPGAFDRGPTGVAVDGRNVAYVADTQSGNVIMIGPLPSQSTGVYAQGLGSPNGIAFDHSGTLYVADQAVKRILAVAPDRTVTTWATGFTAAPYSIAFGPDGALYVSTERDGMVWRVTQGHAPTLWAAIPPAGGAVPSAEGLAFDAAGNLFVGAGASGDVVEVPAGASGIPSVVATGLSGPLHLAFASDGSRTLYVAAAAEGAGSTKNTITTITTTDPGIPLAAPALIGLPLPNPAPENSVAFFPGGYSADPAQFAGAMPVGVATDVGHQAGEPKIEVTNAGNVYFNAAGFNGSTCNPQGVGGFPATSLRESKDGGKTWVDATPPITPPCSLDPYEYYDRTSNRFFDMDLSGQCSSIEYSDNESSAARTWTNTAACGPAALDDHETIAAGPPAPGQVLQNGYPHAMYYCFQDVASARCNSSLDGGSTWTPVTGIPYNNSDSCGTLVTQQNGEQTGHVFVGPDGTAYLPKANCLSGPMVAISHDGGSTWTRVLIHAEAQAADHEAAVAVDGGNTVYYLWISGADLLPYLSLSHDDGATWQGPIPLRTPGMTEADQPDLIAGDAGKIAAYFMGTESDCCYGRTQDGGANQTGSSGDANATQPSMWDNYVVLSTNAYSLVPTFLATTLNDPLHPTTRGNCGPGRCSATFDFLGTYIDNGGRLWGSISDACQPTCHAVGLTGSNVADAGEGLGGQLACGPKLIGSGTLNGPAFAGSNITCGASLTAATPESPAAALLLLVFPVAAGAVIAARRRRGAAALGQ